jgi:hypothetical protein
VPLHFFRRVPRQRPPHHCMHVRPPNQIGDRIAQAMDRDRWSTLTFSRHFAHAASRLFGVRYVPTADPTTGKQAPCYVD